MKDHQDVGFALIQHMRECSMYSSNHMLLTGLSTIFSYQYSKFDTKKSYYDVMGSKD